MLYGRTVITSDSADREDERYFKGIRRLIRRAGETRLDDPRWSSVRLLLELEAEVDAMWATLVARWRQSGWHDSEIGEVLGISGQAVGQRWPRADDDIYLPQRKEVMP